MHLSAIQSQEPVCPAGNVQHWDKILFKFNLDPINSFQDPAAGVYTPQGQLVTTVGFLFRPALGVDTTYEIKVLDTPDIVFNMNKIIVDKLQAQFSPDTVRYGRSSSIGGDVILDPRHITIIDAKYETICVGN